MKRIVKAALRFCGYQLTRIAAPQRAPAALARPAQGGSPPPTFLDVGARGGLAPAWAELQRAGAVVVAAVEPDADECRLLEQRYPGIHCLPWALGDVESQRTLHLTRLPDCSSLLEPLAETLADYPVRVLFDVVGRREVVVRRYDRLVAEAQAPVPTFVKLDVQGYEWNVLEGFGAILDRVLALELEAHFVPLYRSQKTALDLLPWLRQRGFRLRHIEKHGPFEEEFVEGNFFFSRRSQDLDPRGQRWLTLWEAACRIPPRAPFPEAHGPS